MSFDESNFDDSEEEAALPEESNNNRTFLIAVGILGGIILISLACLVGVYLFGSRGSTATQQTEATLAAATTDAANKQFIDSALTSTFEASILPTTTSTPEPTNTAVVNVPTVTSTTDPAAATATVGAALTLAAAAQLTVVPTTTALPNTGFIDDMGVPGLVVMALAFMIVILLARRLRTSPGLSS